MASQPQDYISARGRMTTNAVGGFHGLALMYRDKRTDLGHVHYVCKTNMAVCHKVITEASSVYTVLTHFSILIEPRANMESDVPC